jgi:hypothetical protein
MTTIDIVKNARSKPAVAMRYKPTGAEPAPSKSAVVIKLLARARGATALELTTATDWQPHTVRAHLSGLRKKGIVLVREARKSGESAYRIEAYAPVASVLIPASDPCGLGASNLVDAPTTSIVVA